MSRVSYFEIHADDVSRARQFYQAVFDWKFEKWGEWGEVDYWMITTGPDSEPGINGGLLNRPAPIGGMGSNAFICTITAASLDETIEKVQANGGRIALDKMPVPGVGWLAYFLDTEGNTFGVMENDPTAPAPA